MILAGLMDILVGGGMSTSGAVVAWKFIDAGSTVLALAGLLSGFGIGLTVIKAALKASGKKAIVA